MLDALRKHPRMTDFTSSAVAPLFSTARYKIVNVGHLLHIPAPTYPQVTAINQHGRILLSSFPDPRPIFNYVVNEDGSEAQFSNLCPLCDPTAPIAVVAQGLNNGADVVGYWIDFGGPQPDGAYAGVEWAIPSETVASIASTSAFYGVENAVNDSGVAVGTAGTTEGGGNPGTAYNFSTNEFLGLYGSANACNATATTLDISSAVAINDAGLIVGDAAFPPNCYVDVAVRYPTIGAALPLPVAAPSTAVAVNSRGDVTGTANGNGVGALAFLYHVGNDPSAATASGVHYLPFPQGYGPTKNAEVARGLNDSGDVVGDIYGYDSSGSFSSVAAFLYTHGRTYDINALLPPRSGWRIIDAVGINDRGEIVGTGAFKGPYAYAPFVMKPL